MGRHDLGEVDRGAVRRDLEESELGVDQARLSPQRWVFRKDLCVELGDDTPVEEARTLGASVAVGKELLLDELVGIAGGCDEEWRGGEENCDLFLVFGESDLEMRAESDMGRDGVGTPPVDFVERLQTDLQVVVVEHNQVEDVQTGEGEEVGVGEGVVLTEQTRKHVGVVTTEQGCREQVRVDAVQLWDYVVAQVSDFCCKYCFSNGVASP